MNTIAVIGAQWGDEGKGKITDYLAMKADMVVRYQGGDNAGHTIVFNQDKFALHLIPSGIFNPGATNVMANGMVINPSALYEELIMLEKRGINTSKLYISDRAHVILPYHKMLDAINERMRLHPVGTTHKGIGPTYVDKANRVGIRMGDFVDKQRFKTWLEKQLIPINILLKDAGYEPYSVAKLLQDFDPIQDRLRPLICDTSTLVYQAIQANKKVVFEGAQGTMLCLDHGTYPFVTSSSPTAASIPLNVGIPPQSIKQVVGITKAYTTRVGAGVFATEFNNEMSEKIRKQGNEYGTTTGRARRIGWLDIVNLNHAKRVNGITSLAIMLLDVLKGIHPLKICTSYQLDGKTIDTIPASIETYDLCQPVTIEMPGFDTDISHVKSFEELPIEAQNYLLKIESLTDLPIGLFSVGPDREQTVILKPFFKDID